MERRKREDSETEGTKEHGGVRFPEVDSGKEDSEHRKKRRGLRGCSDLKGSDEDRRQADAECGPEGDGGCCL